MASGPDVPFADRLDAGRQLAERLRPRYGGRSDVVVLALPRGGVPVAAPVARALQAPLDVFVVRKLGVPGHEELAMGAVAHGGARVVNQDVVQSLGIAASVIEAVAEREQAEIERRERAYRDERPYPDVGGRTVIVVDDGLATGASMRAAVRALGRLGPARIVVAVPVAARDTCAELSNEASDVVCVRTPEDLGAVGEWYADFQQTSDTEVRRLLAEAARDRLASAPARSR
jgi:putative phosphoribosyl transferase